MSSYLTSHLHRPQALTYHANQIKKLCKTHKGATVEIAQAVVKTREGEEIFFVGGINSGSDGFNAEQLALMQTWQIEAAPCRFMSVAGLKHQKPHAEENIAIYLMERGARGLRWSRAVVGAHYDTKSGSRSYVCHVCRSLIEQVGGTIEPPFGMSW